MKLLYDSEFFVVVHMQAFAVTGAPLAASGTAMARDDIAAPQLQRHGFEIVDKRSGKEVYLDGSWAELFQQHIVAWQANTPTQETVEQTLEQYAELAQNPVLMH